MSAEEVRRRERVFYDREAAEAPRRGADDYDRALLAALGPLEGLRVLELGCGSGDLTQQLVAAGGEVVAVDVSPAMVGRARERAAGARFLVAPVEATGLEPHSFDRVVGKWILHHVDVAAAGREIARLLKPGGRAAFFENQDRNPFLRASRRMLWRLPGRRSRVGTPDEHPLTDADIRRLAQVFGEVELSYPSFYFFEAVSRVLGHHAWPQLHELDHFVWRRWPRARPHGWHVLLQVQG